MRRITKIGIFLILAVLVGGFCFWWGTTTVPTSTRSGGGDTTENTYTIYDMDIDELDFIEQEQFYETIYVSKEGDNSNGETWDTAYTNIQNAYGNVLSDLDYRTLIMVGPGEYNLNQDDRLEIEKNVFLKGSGRDLTIIENTHANAEWVFQAEDYFRCEDVTIQMAGDVSGILVEEDADVHLNHIRFDGYEATSGDALRIYSNLGEYENLLFNSINQNQDGIVMYNASYNHFENTEFLSFEDSIYIADNSSYNYFLNTAISNSTIALNIDDGDNQVIDNMLFAGNARNIDDEVGNHVYENLFDPLAEQHCIPATLTGVAITCGAGANNYGADTQIYASASADNPFRVVGVMFEIAVQEAYGLRLSYNSGTRFFFETVLEGWDVNEIVHIDTESEIFNHGVRISGSAKSETGSNEIDVWIQIIEY